MGHAIKTMLTTKERQELEAIVGRPSETAGLGRRARVVLLSARSFVGLRRDELKHHLVRMYKISHCSGQKKAAAHVPRHPSLGRRTLGFAANQYVSPCDEIAAEMWWQLRAGAKLSKLPAVVTPHKCECIKLSVSSRTES